jgi:hypothetical protein
MYAPRQRSHFIARSPALALALAVAACSEGPEPMRYELAHSGTHWDVTRSGRRIVDELRPRYPEFFDVILDPADTREPDLRPLRDDLERDPVGPHSYDALHAVAIAYFELNYRANASPGGPNYLSDNFRAAKLLALPWQAYGRVEDGALRDAILDFFEDAGSGEKLATAWPASCAARGCGATDHRGVGNRSTRAAVIIYRSPPGARFVHPDHRPHSAAADARAGPPFAPTFCARG